MNDYVPKVQRVFELKVKCDPPVPVGRLRGGNGVMIPITGGTISGDRLDGEILAGGADWSIRYDDGLVIVDARYAIRASDGSVIQVFNAGSQRMDTTEKSGRTMLTAPRFVAPEGPHDWLNHAVFVGRLSPSTEPGFAVSVALFMLA